MERIAMSAAVSAGLAPLLVVVGCGGPSGGRTDGADAGATDSSAAEVTPDGPTRLRITGVNAGATQLVLAPRAASPCAAPSSCAGSSSINCYGGLDSLADEHATILPPGTLPDHPSDYLFFVPAKTCLNGGRTAATGDTSGLVVLVGGAGPDADGQWTLDFALDYGAYDETVAGAPVKGFGQVFLSPMARTACPAVAPAAQDPTFDLNYANPGSIVVDPTSPGPTELLMLYEGTTRCIGFGGTQTTQTDSFYSTLGIATSSDYGRTWPTYRASMTPLPEQSLAAGPYAALGASGSQVCAGNDCASSVGESYGRYAVLGAPVSVAGLIATGQPPATKSTGASEPSAFVDDVGAGVGAPYLYSVQNYSPGAIRYPGTQKGGVITIARARLGTGRLAFSSWYGQAVAFAATSSGTFAPTSVDLSGSDCGPGSAPTSRCSITNAGLGDDGGGLASPIFPQAPASTAAATAACQAPNQIQLGGSLSYVEATQEYLLTFICSSPVDPVDPTAPAPAGIARGAAWFYATLDATRADLSRQDLWSAPAEVTGSWAWLTSNVDAAGNCPPKGCSACVYDGWYPTFMSLALPAGHLAATGHVFSMRGCQDTGAGGPRAYVSRPFTLTLAKSP